MKSEGTITYWLLLMVCTAVIAYYTFGPDPNDPKVFRGTLYHPAFWLGDIGIALLDTPDGRFRLELGEGIHAAPIFASLAGSRVVVIGHRRKERSCCRHILPSIDVIEVIPDTTSDGA